MKKIFLLAIACVLTACNYSITMLGSQGEATDLVDETATSSPITALSIPANII